MAFLKLTGIQVDVAEPNRPEVERIGDEGRAFSGKLISGYRAKKLPWHIRTVPMLQADAHALRQLVEGEGYSFSYDTDLFSDLKGLGPSSSTGCSIGSSTPSPKYGAGRLRITAGNRCEYTIPPAFAGTSAIWTLAHWKYSLDFYGVWEHFIVRGDGTKFKAGSTTTEDPWVSYDGSILKLRSPADVYPDWNVGSYATGALIRGGAALNIYVAEPGGNTDIGGPPDFDSAPALEDAVVDGEIVWKNYGGGWGHFDDVVFLPYLVPDAWVADIYAEMNARAFTPLPRLRMTGDAVAALPGAVLTAEGRTRESPVLQAVLGGDLQDNIEVLDFDLMEV